MTAYAFFSKDIMPMPGGYMNQGNKWMEAVMYLQHLQNKADAERNEKTKGKNNQYARPGTKSAKSPKPPSKTFKKGRKAPSAPKTIKARQVR